MCRPTGNRLFLANRYGGGSEKIHPISHPRWGVMNDDTRTPIRSVLVVYDSLIMVNHEEGWKTWLGHRNCL